MKKEIQPDLIIRKWTPETRKLIRNKSGIYAIYIVHTCLYVGATINLENRVKPVFKLRHKDNHLLHIILQHIPEHFEYRQDIESYTLRAKIYFCLKTQLKEQEQHIIKELKPRLNITGKRSEYRYKKKRRVKGETKKRLKCL